MKKKAFNYAVPIVIYNDMKSVCSEINYNCNEVLNALLFYFFNLSELEKHQLMFSYRTSDYFKEVNK